ncbi:MAG: 2-amino-4-hydroxy-6-hydroxymethyldihydropteridine diphosphokinase [Planctomycetes bacterium]|nr:2-amino-4-hydroxy-6-hydroxymethyldihydropteridine diphosphokinase [Planctomycetota bacterium]
MQHVAYISLGGNIEPRAQTLIQALSLLDDYEGISVRRISQLIETEPEGGPAEQGKFLNGAAVLFTDLTAEELLDVLHEVEAQMGRHRESEKRWGPRTCDLDLLLFDDLVIESDKLTVPHPRMHKREFVLRPLAQIAGDVVHPVLHKSISELLADLEQQDDVV